MQKSKFTVSTALASISLLLSQVASPAQEGAAPSSTFLEVYCLPQQFDKRHPPARLSACEEADLMTLARPGATRRGVAPGAATDVRTGDAGPGGGLAVDVIFPAATNFDQGVDFNGGGSVGGPPSTGSGSGPSEPSYGGDDTGSGGGGSGSGGSSGGGDTPSGSGDGGTGTPGAQGGRGNNGLGNGADPGEEGDTGTTGRDSENDPSNPGQRASASSGSPGPGGAAQGRRESPVGRQSGGGAALDGRTNNGLGNGAEIGEAGNTDTTGVSSEDDPSNPGQGGSNSPTGGGAIGNAPGDGGADPRDPSEDAGPPSGLPDPGI